MPLMRIRSVEIVFEDELSTCTDTGLLDRSIELILSDSDDSTKCVEDLEHLQQERDDNDSVTLNAEADLSDDNSYSKHYTKNVRASQDNREQNESLTLPNDDTLSLNISELGDSGRFTEEASSSHIEVPIITYDDAVLSHSFDAVNVDESSTIHSMYEVSEISGVNTASNRLYEYIDSNSDSSDNTAVCDDEYPCAKPIITVPNTDPEDQTVYDSYDLQYDSFVDIGKF
ncbi:jg10665 [Pararge aegeria aegeria]|uniref:Jg10665 protein n=1 Tax=Pararge aegeria aegeria TaxID=348720 RepID=A0A8S4RUM4_9NEOP|nr:jg10665 [Pararge aegeria aegeria]